MRKLAVVSFGRMAPVTVGHRKLALKLRALADANDGDALLYLSKKYDGKAKGYKREPKNPRVPSNPLNYEDKVRFVEDALGDILTVARTEHAKLFDILQELGEQGYTDIMLLGDEQFLNSPFEKYNGVLYNFNSITKIISGTRCDNSDDFLETVSATKARNAVFANDYSTFKSIVATKTETRNLWDKLREELAVTD